MLKKQNKAAHNLNIFIMKGKFQEMYLIFIFTVMRVSPQFILVL